MAMVAGRGPRVLRVVERRGRGGAPTSSERFAIAIATPERFAGTYRVLDHAVQFDVVTAAEQRLVFRSSAGVEILRVEAGAAGAKMWHDGIALDLAEAKRIALTGGALPTEMARWTKWLQTDEAQLIASMWRDLTESPVYNLPSVRCCALRPSRSRSAMARYPRVAAWTAAGLLAGAGNVGPLGADESRRPVDGTTTILETLADVQKDLKALREEVAQLRKAVADLGRGGRPSAPPPPEAVDLGKGAPLGRADAPVAVVEFSEFQCPFCRRFYEGTFAQLKENYVATGKLRYVFRDFPLPIHSQARRAAVAARCARHQGGFWPMHDALFANQDRLGPDTYEELARGPAARRRYVPRVPSGAGNAEGSGRRPSSSVG
jgi:protein-disulfide isomerase